jgi:hypothetical protein
VRPRSRNVASQNLAILMSGAKEKKLEGQRIRATVLGDDGGVHRGRIVGH